MIQEIKSHIEALEKRENIKILLAVESGSRAWGFPSPDSDYDIRIIYIRESNWYLSIDEKKDTIEYFHGELLDINGWDIRKTLRLLRKSNATPFEWAQSPIIYKEEGNFRTELLELANKFFQPNHSLNHYKGIAKNSYLSNISAGNIKLKKLFYVIRPLLAANWIIEKNLVPPMDIDNLLEIVKDKSVERKITELIRIKATANEDYIHSTEQEIIDFIDVQFQQIEEKAELEDKNIPDSAVLDSFYRELLSKFNA